MNCHWRWVGALFVAIAFASGSGCSNSGTTAPKADLSEQEKQQVRELNEQRASEWGSTKKK